MRALRAHATLAPAVLLAFVASVTVVPFAHLVDHRDDHVHLPGGGTVHAHDDGRVHVHVAEEHVASSDARARRPAPPVHGVGAPEHLGTAVVSRPVFLLPPPHRATDVAPEVSTAETVIVAPLGRAGDARGPPEACARCV